MEIHSLTVSSKTGAPSSIVNRSKSVLISSGELFNGKALSTWSATHIVSSFEVVRWLVGVLKGFYAGWVFQGTDVSDVLGYDIQLFPAKCNSLRLGSWWIQVKCDAIFRRSIFTRLFSAHSCWIGHVFCQCIGGIVSPRATQAGKPVRELHSWGKEFVKWVSVRMLFGISRIFSFSKECSGLLFERGILSMALCKALISISKILLTLAHHSFQCKRVRLSCWRWFVIGIQHTGLEQRQNPDCPREECRCLNQHSPIVWVQKNSHVKNPLLSKIS